jgi:hypothetical protein
MVEVVNYGEETRGPQVVAYRIQDSLPLGREPAEYQHRLRRDYVDNTPYSTIIQYQVNELRDFQIVSRDQQFTFRGYYQVMLTGVGQADVPCGDTVDF